MKKLLIVLIISLMGCYSTPTPVDTMSNLQLQSEYNELQAKQLRTERLMMYDQPSYMYMPFGNSFLALPMGNNYIRELEKLEKRMVTVGDEMSRRGILP